MDTMHTICVMRDLTELETTSDTVVQMEPGLEKHQSAKSRVISIIIFSFQQPITIPFGGATFCTSGLIWTMIQGGK